MSSPDTPQQDDPQRPGDKGSMETSPLAIAFALGEVKGEVTNLRNDLGGWKADLKDTLADRNKQIDDKFTDQETRLRTIEVWHTKVTGLATLLGVVGGWAMEWIIRHV